MKVSRSLAWSSLLALFAGLNLEAVDPQRFMKKPTVIEADMSLSGEYFSYRIYNEKELSYEAVVMGADGPVGRVEGAANSQVSHIFWSHDRAVMLIDDTEVTDLSIIDSYR